MAGTGRRSRRRRGDMRNRSSYEEGNAVKRLQEERRRERPPVYTQERREEQAEAVKKPRSRAVSRQTLRNQERAQSMNPVFVVFLAVVSVAILMISVNYLQLKSDITATNKTIASLDSQLTRLKEDNDAYYSQVNSNIDLNEIKKIAVGRLGMRAPVKDQIRTYQTSRGSYIRQYQDIPEAE